MSGLALVEGGRLNAQVAQTSDQMAIVRIRIRSAHGVSR